jgi:phage/plasmid-associated DNA primase
MEQLLKQTQQCKTLLANNKVDEVKSILSEIKQYLKNDKNNLYNKNILFEATKKNIIQYLPESKRDVCIRILELILSKHKKIHKFEFTYLDNINYDGMLRLEIMDLNFIFEYIDELPLTTIFKTKYIFENGQKIQNNRIYYLFKVSNSNESQKLYHSVKNGEVNKIFDGKCELFIESGNRNNIQKLSYDQKPVEIPSFIIDHVFPKAPEDIKLTEILGRCSHKLVSELVLLLPRDDYVSTIVDKNIVVYRFNKNTKLYEQIKEDRIRSSLQNSAIEFVKSKQIFLRNEIDNIYNKIKKISSELKSINEKIEKNNDGKQKNSETMKLEINKKQLEQVERTLSKQRDSLIESSERFNKVLFNIESVPFMDNVTKIFISEKAILKENFADSLDKRMDVFNFKNGLVELRTGLFRERTANDYFTITLNYDYKLEYVEQIFERIRQIILRICNDDTNLMECYLSWFGYCMTGETSYQRALWSIGLTAQNGKTTGIEGFEQMAHIYCVKLNVRTFEEKFQNKHKQLALLKLARLAYIEEMERKSIDIQAYKDYAGAKNIGGNEILYGTAESIRIHFKLMFTSNKFPKFKSDAGVLRRGLCIEHKNLFYEGNKYESNKHKKGVYLKDSSLGELFEQDDYKLAFFHLLLPYATRYYKSKFDGVNMSSLIETWETICCENDAMGQFLDENYDVTENDNDRIQKDDFVEHYQNYYNLKNITWNTLINEIKRLGLEYDRTKRIDGKKGVILGLTKKQNCKQYNYGKRPDRDVDFLCEDDE